MPTFESKFGVGDRVRVTQTGTVGIVQTVSFNVVGENPVYYLSGASRAFLGFELEPAPQPEVWPKVDGPWVRYTDGPPAGYDSRLAERIAKLERLAWLLRQEAEVGLPTKHLLEKRDLRDYFAPYHGPNGEVYLEPQK